MRVMGVKGLTLYHLKSHLQVWTRDNFSNPYTSFFFFCSFVTFSTLISLLVYLLIQIYYRYLMINYITRVSFHLFYLLFFVLLIDFHDFDRSVHPLQLDRRNHLAWSQTCHMSTEAKWIERILIVLLPLFLFKCPFEQRVGQIDQTLTLIFFNIY